MQLRTKLFHAEHLRPLEPPDGSSLEEQLNAFLATKPSFLIADVQISLATARGGDSPQYYSGAVLYKVNS